jgi:hypothetical protein
MGKPGMTDVQEWGRTVYGPPSSSSSGVRRDLSEGTWWPAGKYVVPRSRLKQLLALSARHHARQAIRLFVSDDLHDLLEAAASTGTAVELLTKAYLASVDYALLADRGDRDSVLTLGGNSSLADVSAQGIRTISAVDALALAKHLQKDLPWIPRDSLVLRVRNAALHMGLVEREELRRAVVQMCRLSSVLVKGLGLDNRLYWGDDAAPVVEHLLDEAKSETARTVAAKKAAAHERLTSLLTGLDPADQKILLAALSGRPTSTIEHGEAQTCPVCGQQGWLLCVIERGPVEFEPDDGGNGYAWAPRTAYPVEFECPVCELALESLELAEFDFPSEIELDADDDPPEAYEYEPDEDILRGR